MSSIIMSLVTVQQIVGPPDFDGDPEMYITIGDVEQQVSIDLTIDEAISLAAMVNALIAAGSGEAADADLSEDVQPPPRRLLHVRPSDVSEEA